MTRTARLLAGTLAALAVTVGLTTMAAPAAGAVGGDPVISDPYPPPPIPTAFPGLFIDFDGDMTPGLAGPTCTLGAVGTDSAGRKVGITAGHCNPKTIQRINTTPGHPDVMIPKYVGAPRGQHVTTNDHPVYDRNAVEYANKNHLPAVPPIGWIRWVDGDVCKAGDMFADGTKCPRDAVADAITTMTEYYDKKYNDSDVNPNSRTDYMVIEFAPGVQLSSQVKDAKGNNVQSTWGGGPFKVNAINRDSSGAPALPWTFLDYVETFGANSSRETPSATPAPSNGLVMSVSNGLIWSVAGFGHGDSGGPVTIRGTNKWVGIITATIPGKTPPWVSTSAKNILNDLNPRGVTGSGFTITNN